MFVSNLVSEIKIVVRSSSKRNSIDIIIVEDDPYFFLQFEEYKAKSERSTASVKHDEDKFLASLAPSYLQFDYQGRVIRLDTFSKVSTCSILIPTSLADVSFDRPLHPVPGLDGSLVALYLPNVLNVKARPQLKRHAVLAR